MTQRWGRLPMRELQVVVFELNANNHSQRRALANAMAIHAIELDGRLPITTSAKLYLQPDGHGIQRLGIGFFVPEPVQRLVQPPGYVNRCMLRLFSRLEIQCSVPTQ